MTIDPVGTSEANLVRNSIRYRLGDLFISICLKPWKIFSHARKFRDIVSVIAQRRLIRDFPRDFEIGQPNDPVLRSGLLNRLSINQLDKAQAKLKSALQGGTGPLTLDDPEFQPLIDRVEELRDLVRQGLRDDVGSMAARSGQVRSKHIAIAAHTGLPLRSNGYAIRTEALASKLTSLRPSWDINVWLRYSKINAELNTSIQANYIL